MSSLTKINSPPCPYLPAVECSLPISHAKPHRKACGPAYYLACLELAQSLWLSGLPAPALLQLNKSMMAEIPANASLLESSPIPYKAIQWIISNVSGSHFIGNPVRHFQHLASRMNHNQPQPELRSARAWICLHIAESILPAANNPRDSRQIELENLTIPTIEEALSNLKSLSPHASELAHASAILR